MGFMMFTRLLLATHTHGDNIQTLWRHPCTVLQWMDDIKLYAKIETKYVFIAVWITTTVKDDGTEM